MNEQEYQSLKESIRIEGLKEPIIIDTDFMIVDGTKRYRACQELQIEPVFETVRGNDRLLIKRRKLYNHLRIQNRDHYYRKRIAELVNKKNDRETIKEVHKNA